MTPAGLALARRFAADLEALHELHKHDPAAAGVIVASLVAHLRSSRPEAVSPPLSPVVDPRGER
jgi:hypothetical protein